MCDVIHQAMDVFRMCTATMWNTLNLCLIHWMCEMWKWSAKHTTFCVELEFWKPERTEQTSWTHWRAWVRNHVCVCAISMCAEVRMYESKSVVAPIFTRIFYCLFHICSNFRSLFSSFSCSPIGNCCGLWTIDQFIHMYVTI